MLLNRWKWHKNVWRAKTEHLERQSIVIGGCTQAELVVLSGPDKHNVVSLRLLLRRLLDKSFEQDRYWFKRPRPIHPSFSQGQVRHRRRSLMEVTQINSLLALVRPENKIQSQSHLVEKGHAGHKKRGGASISDYQLRTSNARDIKISAKIAPRELCFGDRFSRHLPQLPPQ